MTTYLVTGACGFIGSNYVHYLSGLERESTIVAVDNLGFASNEANLASVRDRVELVVADIADFEQMLSVYEAHAPDYVVNFAAESHNDRAIDAPGVFMRSNALGAQAMLECSRMRPVSRHVHVSTIEVYGELPEHAEFFTEASPLNAKTPYSAAKAAGDQIVRAYMQTYPDMDIAMTHCANNYGPYQLPEKLIPLMITNVLRGRKVPVYGDGLNDETGCTSWTIAQRSTRSCMQNSNRCRPRRPRIRPCCRSSTSALAMRSPTSRSSTGCLPCWAAILPSGSSTSLIDRTTIGAISSTRTRSKPNWAGHPPSSSNPVSKKLSAGTSTTKPGGRPFSRARANCRSTGPNHCCKC